MIPDPQVGTRTTDGRGSFAARSVFLYAPDLRRLSAGFSAESGIDHTRPLFTAPVIRPSLHRTATLLSEMLHLSASSLTVIYFISHISSAHIIRILYPNKRTMSILFRIISSTLWFYSDASFGRVFLCRRPARHKNGATPASNKLCLPISSGGS